jgi:sulfur-carrier protein
MIRVVLPGQLRILARIEGEVTLDVAGEATQGSVLEALERRYPMLQGDLSHEPADAPLPAAVAIGSEPLLVVGAMSGG